MTAKQLTVKQNFIWNAIGSIVNQAGQWLITILVVVLSSSYENSGILAFAMAAGNIFNALATYNMRTYQVSDVNNENSSQDYIGFRIFTVCASYAVFAVYSVIVPPGSNTFICMMVYLAYKADEAFAVVLYAIDQKNLRMDFIGISQGIRGVLSPVAFSIVIWFSQSLALAMLAMFVVCLLVTLLYDIPAAGRLERVKPRADKAKFQFLLKKCAPLVVATVVFAMTSALARQYYGIVYGEEALGIYAAVATPCALVQALASYLYSPFLVPLSEEWNQKGHAGFASRFIKVFALLLGVSIACIILACLVGPWFLILVFGDSIAEYAWMITPAVIAASAMAFCFFFTDIFILQRRFGAAFAINVCSFATCAILIGPLAYWFGMNGVNLTLTVSNLIAITLGATLLIGALRKERRHHE